MNAMYIASVVLIATNTTVISKTPRLPEKPKIVERFEIENRTVDEMKEFWDALRLDEGLCVYNPDVQAGRIRWRRCLVDKRDNRSR